jgi:uncharacterized membrane protein
MGRFSLLCITAAALPFCGSAGAPGPAYVVRDLGLPGSYSWAAAINDHGVVAANTLLPDGRRQCFVIDGARVTALEAGTECRGINNHGEVVGDLEKNGPWFAFVWRNGRLTELPKPDVQASSASAINDDGRIAGSAWLNSNCGQPVAVMWDAGSLIPFGPFTNPFYCDNSFALAINDRARVVGYYQIDDFYRVGFTWEDGSHKRLELAPSTVTGINKFGVMSGYTGNYSCPTQAFLLKNGAPNLLPETGTSQLLAINDSGLAAGWLSERLSCIGWTHAILWDGGAITTLPDLDGQTISKAYAINKHGDVAGISGTRAVVWRKDR